MAESQAQGTPAPNEGEATADVQQEASPQAEERGFDQKSVNKLVGTARKEARAALLSDLGYENLDELKGAVEAQRTLEEEMSSEAEKLQKKLEKLSPKAERADELEKVLTTFLEREREGVPEHIIALLDRMDVTEQLAYLAEHKENLVPQEEGRQRVNAPQTTGTGVQTPTNGGQTPEEAHANWIRDILLSS